MSKTSVADWSQTAASNTDIDGTSIDEGCAAAGINNAIRSIMAQIATAFAGSLALNSITPVTIAGIPLFPGFAPVVLSDAATITPNQASGVNFTLTIGGNRTLANMTNPQPGSGGVIVITQDGTGSRTLTFGTNYNFPNAVPSLSTAAGAVDVISYFVVSSTVIVCGLTKGYVHT
jgi:hypothetical protein